jgi:hypothetical protein
MTSPRSLLLIATLAIAPASALTLSACGGDVATSSGASVDAAQARELGAIAKRIQSNPEQADATLKEAGLSRAQFEAAVYTIASDPALSKAYASAL